jgi:hypothetical protein
MESAEKVGLAPDVLDYPVGQATTGRVPVPLFQQTPAALPAAAKSKDTPENPFLKAE